MLDLTRIGVGSGQDGGFGGAESQINSSTLLVCVRTFFLVTEGYWEALLWAPHRLYAQASRSRRQTWLSSSLNLGDCGVAATRSWRVPNSWTYLARRPAA